MLPKVTHVGSHVVSTTIYLLFLLKHLGMRNADALLHNQRDRQEFYNRWRGKYG